MQILLQSRGIHVIALGLQLVPEFSLDILHGSVQVVDRFLVLFDIESYRLGLHLGVNHPVGF